jgi:hypothetical protein
MNNITSISEIRDAIVFLENEQEVKGQLLRQEFQETYEKLKPVNLLKSAVNNISSKPLLPLKLLGMTTGVGLGFLARKIVVGASGGIFRKIIGTILQLGVTNLIARHPAEIKSISQLVNKSLFSRGKVNAGKQ